MKRIYVIVAFVFCLAHLDVSAQSYFDLNIQEYVDKEGVLATYENVNETDNYLSVSYSLGTLIITEDDLFPTTYNLSVDKFGQHISDGEPMLPMLSKLFYLPDGKLFSYIRLVSRDSVELPIELAPSRPFLSDNDTIGWQKSNIQSIRETSFSNNPDSIVKLEFVGKKLGRNVCRVSISPVQYDSEDKRIKVYNNISFEIGMSDDSEPDAANGEDSQYYTVENGLLKRSYLILAPNAYKETLNEFSLWKKQSGFNVVSLYSDNWTTSTIESAIDSVYYATKTLQYVLLVGDHNVMPGKRTYSSYATSGSYLSDYEYSQVAPSTERSVYIGRIPGRNTIEIKNALAKIISYEKKPPLDSRYYLKSHHSAYFQPSTPTNFEERRFVRTAEDILNFVSTFGIEAERNYYASASVSPKFWSLRYADGKEIPTSLQRPNFSWDGNTTRITSFFGKGGLYALYRGHGAIDRWGTPSFSVNNIVGLSTTDSPPFVFSVTCLSGRYDLPNGGLAQSLISKRNGGCVGVFAASEVSYSGLNDAFLNGMFNQWFKGDGIDYISGSNVYPPIISPSYLGVTLGEILEGGLERMCEIYPHSSTTEYNKKIFHIFGDPSMMLHTKKPTTFSGVEASAKSGLSHSSMSGCFPGTFYMSLGEEGIISITDSNNKTVSCYGSEISVNSPFFPFDIVITGHNKVPLFYTYYNYEGTGAPSTYNNWIISRLSPNPTQKEEVNVSITYDSEKIGAQPLNMALLIVSIEGKASCHIAIEPKPQTTLIPLNDMPAGTYIVALIVDGVKTDTKTLIITN